MALTALKRLPDERTPVLLSAHADDLISVDARAIADYLDRFPETTVEQVARQLRQTRRVRQRRAVIRAADRAELIDGLRALAAGNEHPRVARSALSSAPRQAFVFPGQGGHWPGMGADAYRVLPIYRNTTDRCAAAFDAAGIVSPLRYLVTGGDSSAFSEIEVQGAQFIHAVALAEVWRSCGVLPDLTIGQSLGEIAAAFVAGTLALSDAVAVVAARAGVVNRLPGRYAMATLGISPDTAESLIAAADGWVELSVVYSASTVAVSGDRDAVLGVAEAVRSSGRFAREITAGFPGHTSILEQLGDEFRAQLPDSEFADTPVQFIGGATGDVVASDTPFVDYWYGNLRNTVRLDHAFDSAIRLGAGSFVELSAHPALLFTIGQIFEAELPEGPEVLVGSTHRDEPLADTLSANIVAAAMADPGYAWGDLLAADVAKDAGLRGFPNAPMRAVPMWAHSMPLPAVPGAGSGLTVATEHWEQLTPNPAVGPPVRLAVVDLGAGGTLTPGLRAEIESHPAVVPSASQDAEIVVAIAPALESVDAPRAADALVELIASGLLDYPVGVGPRCHTIWLITAGAERVSPADPVPAAGHAALAAMHRGLGFEYAEQVFSHLDLPSGELPPATGAAVVDALLSASGESALRASASGYVLLQRTLRDAPIVPQWSLDSGVLDEVVITGGAGAIGLHYARYLAERGARRIVLLSRRAADPELLAALAAEHGTVVISPPCDITDPAQLSAVAAEYAGCGASLVVHAAGSATFATTANLTSADVADTFGAKVIGLARMNELWPTRPDARTLLCSSVTGVWGGQGVVVYSAANRLLDAMAAQLRSRGRHCVAMKYGLWQRPAAGAASGGMVDAGEMARLERAGLREMAPRQAIEASLCEYDADPIVFAADAGRFRTFLNSRQSQQRDNVRPTIQVVESGPAAGTATVVDTVRSQLAAVLGIRQAGELDLEASLFDLGVDSMLALDLRNRLKRTIGRTVSLATLMGEITGDELVQKLEDAGERSETTEKVDISRD